MTRLLEYTVGAGAVVMVAAIVFVKAGQKGGVNGGQQTAMIAQGTGQGLATVASALEGGA